MAVIVIQGDALTGLNIKTNSTSSSETHCDDGAGVLVLKNNANASLRGYSSVKGDSG
jgi:hypothetical protein